MRTVLLLLALALGFAAGRALHSPTPPPEPVAAGNVADGPRTATAAEGRRLDAPTSLPASRQAPTVPFHAPQDTTEFQARLDEIAAAARAGSSEAAVAMWDHLSQCNGEAARDLRNTRRSYERDMQDIANRERTLGPEGAAALRGQREQMLASAEARAHLCAEVGQQSDNALAWLEYAVAQGSPTAVHRVFGSLMQKLDVEHRVRHAERLVRLRDIAVQRVTTGDLSRGPDAPRFMMMGYNSGLLPYSAEHAEGYAYAWWLARGESLEPGQWIGPSPLENERSRLTPDQRAEAERIGQAAFEACCG